MTEIIRSLDDIDPGYRVLYCDLWGCLHDGVRVFPAAVAALERFRARGGTVVLLTNSPRPGGGGRAPARRARRAAVAAGTSSSPRATRRRRRWSPASSAGGSITSAPSATWCSSRTRRPAARHRAGAARGGRGHRLHRPLRRPHRDAGRLPGDDPLRQDQGAEAALRQPRHHRRRRRPPHLLRRRHRRGLYRGRRAAATISASRIRRSTRSPARSSRPMGDAVQPDEILCVGDGIATDVAGAMGEGLDVALRHRRPRRRGDRRPAAARGPDPALLAALSRAAARLVRASPSAYLR